MSAPSRENNWTRKREMVGNMPETKQDDVQKAEKAWAYSQAETGYVTVSPSLPAACAGCRWFNSYGSGYDEHPDCRIVDSYPNPIEATGWCNKYEAVPTDPYPQTPMPVVIVDADVTAVVVEGAAEVGGKAEEELPAEEAAADPEADEDTAEVATVDVPSGIRKLVLNIGAVVEKALGRKDDLTGGFKVFKDASGADRWVAWYSNNFEDRDAEFFSEKGIDAFVERLDMGVVPMPELWTWHEPGTRYGVADWVDRIGHFAVASGTYDDTEAGRTGKAYDKAHAGEYGVSHGFLFTQKGVHYEDGKRVFDEFNTFEITTLPKKSYAANPLAAFAVDGDLGIEEKAMKPEKREHLVKKHGEGFVADLEAKTEKLGKEMEGLAGYKDFVHPDEETAGTNAKALADADQSFAELMPQLIDGTSEAVVASTEAVKEVVLLRQQVKELSENYAEVRKQLDLRPRIVSQDSDTAVDTTQGVGKELLETVQKQMTETDKFWGTSVVTTP